MVDIIKQDMTDIWASAGDITAPDPSKIATGWVVEAVPRQWWNWFENRQDTNIAYMLQKGIPEWDVDTQYLTNKSYVQRNNIVYKCIVTNTNTDPSTTPLNWVKAFPESSNSLEAIRVLTPVANGLPYYTGTNTAAQTTLTPFARTILDDVDDAAVRTTIAAQQSNVNLTSLSGVTAATNTIPYFNSATTMIVTPFTAFGRSLIDDIDAATARATLGVDSSVDVAANLAAGLATKQPLDATLTALAATSTANNTLSYWNGVDSTVTTPFTPYARTLLDDADATTARATLGVDSAVDAAAALAAGLATKQPLDATLTAFAGLATGINQLAYATGTDTFAQTTLTAFARSILDDADAVTVRATIGSDDASNLTTGTLPLARLPADLVGKNAATATALQTARTIQGVSFNGTANITLSVVDKDSAVGSATLPSGTSAQRTASPSNGMIRYNNETNEFEGYQNGSWAGIGGGNPLFTVLWWPTRSNIPSGYVPLDGQLLTRASYSAAWAVLNNGSSGLLTTDATWLSSGIYRGFYSSGNGSTTFRAPDFNGKVAGSTAVFLRGDGNNSTGIPSQIQGSDNLSHTHTFQAGAGAIKNTFPTVNGGFTAGTGYADGGNPAIITATGGSESRPVNVTGVWIAKLIGGATDLSQEDASVAVAALDTRVTTLESAGQEVYLWAQLLPGWVNPAGPARIYWDTPGITKGGIVYDQTGAPNNWFVLPVSGVYRVTCNLLPSAVGTSITLGLDKGGVLSSPTQCYSNSSLVTVSMTYIGRFTAGDKVWATLSTGTLFYASGGGSASHHSISIERIDS